MPPAEMGKELAKRVTAIRLQKTWTREKLADMARINIHSLKRFERSGQISLERLIAIAEALDMQQEIERLFKPRHRIDIDNWQLSPHTVRKRGKRNLSPVSTP